MFKRLIFVLFLCFISPIKGRDLKSGVIGGMKAQNGMFPFQVSLQTKSCFDHFCGGSIIDKNHILTAGHCIVDKSNTSLRTDDFVAVVGDVLQGGRFAKKHEIKYIFVHELFDSITLHNDIAVLRIIGSFQFTSYVSPIKLPSSEIHEYFFNVSGWGSVGRNINNPITPSYLFYAEVGLVSYHNCSNNYKQLNVTITSNMICAGDNNTDACQGDSGGPLSLHHTLVGIVSFAKGCASHTFFGVYTKVYKYRAWILHQLQKSGSFKNICNYYAFTIFLIIINKIISYK